MAEGRGHPRPGDLIMISRPRFQHWALYVGDGYVIHVTPVDEGAPSLLGSSSSVSATRAKVRKELLTNVAGNDKWRVNNKYDESHTPRPVEEIIKSAEEKVGKEVSYDVLSDNCEHFVTELRYGEAVSDQAVATVFATLAAGTVLAGGAALATPAVAIGGIVGGVIVAAATVLDKAISR